MSTFNRYNFSVPACSYTTESLFQAAPQVCGDYIVALQTCPSASVLPTVRLKAANQTATCMEAL